MPKSRLSVSLPNGSAFTLRIDWPATYRTHESGSRTMWRYVCRNSDGRIVARGSDLGSPAYGSQSPRDVLPAACALVSFASHYAECLPRGMSSDGDPLSADDRALGQWWEDNESELWQWQESNDPEHAPEHWTD